MTKQELIEALEDVPNEAKISIVTISDQHDGVTYKLHVEYMMGAFVMKGEVAI